jgi:hypothetical protein
MSKKDIPAMKNQGQLVTLPSIPIRFNVFAPIAFQHPSTYFPTEFVLQIILHTIGCLCPKTKWSFLLHNCIIPTPTSEHFRTKMLSCRHHKNLKTKSLFQLQLCILNLLMWPWKYMVWHGIIVPIITMFYINFFHHIENTDRTKC